MSLVLVSTLIFTSLAQADIIDCSTLGSAAA